LKMRNIPFVYMLDYIHNVAGRKKIHTSGYNTKRKGSKGHRSGSGIQARDSGRMILKFLVIQDRTAICRFA
jgi:hypothetical protein